MLSQENIDALAATVTPEVASAIDTAFNNIKAFHEAQMPSDIALTTTPGVKCELRFTALDAVGLYIPGGTLSIIGVSTAPGAMVITRMPTRASSRAIGKVIDATPPFDAA